MKNWPDILVPPESRLIDVIAALDRSAAQICLVATPDRRLLGTVTDGDIRRGLLRGVRLEDSVDAVMNPRPLTATPATPGFERLAMMRSRKLRHLPLVDDGGVVVGIETEQDHFLSAILPNWVVLMVGGQGQRLRPLTATTPKPLLPVGGRPLLETILVQLAEAGFSRIFLAVNYMAEKFEEAFGDGSRLGIEIGYLREEGQMGTAGALACLPERPTHPVLVMNGDVLTSVNYRALLDFHHEHRAAATICVREHVVQIPYGVVDLDHSRVVRLQEKPAITSFVNAGIYVVEPGLLDGLEPGRRCDMPALLQRAMDGGGEVAAFPIREYWLDIGRMDDFAKANGDFEQVFKPSGDANP